MKKLEVLLILILFIILSILIIYIPNYNKFNNRGNLIINEVMSSNYSTIKDSYGLSSDYIEIYNGYDYDINLEGYYLSDEDLNLKKWIFPNITIKSKDYLLVYASGKDTYENNELHTNFKLSKDEEIVTLSDKDGNYLSRIIYTTSIKDTSYGFNGQEYVYYYYGTPGKINNSTYIDKSITKTSTKDNILITEYMLNNTNYIKNSNNEYTNLIEIYNNTNKDLNLEDYYIYYNKTIYNLPNIIIKSNEYKIIYDTKNKSKEEIYLNLDLKENENLILLDKYRNENSNITLLKTSNNNSYGLYNKEWLYYSTPSIGSENKDNYLEEINIEKDITINEVSSSPNAFIELKNNTNETINLSNYSISDKNSSQVSLPNINIEPNNYIVLYGSDDYNYIDNNIYIGFNINNYNEVIYLYKNNLLIDEFNVGKLDTNTSSGRDEEGNHIIYNEITLGYSNSSNYYYGYAKAPVFNINGGYLEKDTEITLNSSEGSTIYYTTDGSFPSTSSNKYTSPIKVTETTIIKAISVKDKYLTSDIVSRTFFVNDTHDVAIVSISSDNDNLYGYKGLLSNYMSDIETEITFEFYEKDGSLGTSFQAGTKLVGQDSRLEPQKSMAIYLRKQYGLNSVTYPFFEDTDVVTFKSFILRNSGEDPNRIKIKDTFLCQVLEGQMDIDMQKYRPVAVYINGKYYGLYNLREKVNENYIVSNYDYEKGDNDLIKGYDTVQAGSIDDYNDLLNYVGAHDLSNDEYYNYVASIVDIQEVINYWIVQTYYANTDTGNIRYWKNKDGKWRIILFDQDWSMVSSTYRGVDLKYPFEPYGHGTGNYFSTKLTYNLYKNANFRDLYYKTLAYHLKNTFNPDRMISILDEMTKEVENEMPKHISRWYNVYINENKSPISSMASWYTNIDNLKQIIKNRYTVVKGRIKSDFNLTTEEYNKYFGDI